MGEFSSRVDAQRQILKVVNDKPWKSEQLLALNSKAIQRWITVNHLDAATRLVTLLDEASSRIFVMANLSDDPIAADYKLTREQVDSLELNIREELASN